MRGAGLESKEHPRTSSSTSVDTLRADHLGSYGYERATDPHLAAFAEDAVLFEAAYAPSSWTRPSTATLLTGLAPAAHGAITGADRIDPDVALLGDLLASRGYRSFGWTANPNVLDVWGFDRGFERFVDLLDGKRIDTDAQHFLAELQGGQHLVEDPEGRPRFLYLHTVDPHQPYGPPRTAAGEVAGFAGFDAAERGLSFDPSLVQKPARVRPGIETQALRATVDAYDAEIAYSDAVFGALLDELRRTGRYDDALIVYTSDHGEEFLDHGSAGHQQTLFEEVVRVPLLVKFPGNVHAGRRIDAPASLLDVVPTVLRAAGAAVPQGLEGVDLRELARGAGDDQRQVFFDLDREARPGRPNFTAQGLREGRFKLIHQRSPQERTMVFDLVEDPRETNDLAASRPDLVERLGERLEERAAQGARGWHLVAVHEPNAGQRSIAFELETDGRFRNVEAHGFEDGSDGWEGTAQRIRVWCELRNRPNPGIPPPRELLDRDWLSFTLEPADASVTVVAAPEGAELAVGDADSSVDAFPRTFTADGDARASSATLRARTSTAPDGPLHGRLVLLHVGGSRVEVDAALEERLRALGYGGDGH